VGVPVCGQGGNPVSVGVVLNYGGFGAIGVGGCIGGVRLSFLTASEDSNDHSNGQKQSKQLLHFLFLLIKKLDFYLPIFPLPNGNKDTNKCDPIVHTGNTNVNDFLIFY
jgi:hypothetical protein